jgi:hypothetical protein
MFLLPILLKSLVKNCMDPLVEMLISMTIWL